MWAVGQAWLTLVFPLPVPCFEHPMHQALKGGLPEEVCILFTLTVYMVVAIYNRYTIDIYLISV